MSLFYFLGLISSVIHHRLGYCELGPLWNTTLSWLAVALDYNLWASMKTILISPLLSRKYIYFISLYSTLSLSVKPQRYVPQNTSYTDDLLQSFNLTTRKCFLYIFQLSVCSSYSSCINFNSHKEKTNLNEVLWRRCSTITSSVTNGSQISHSSSSVAVWLFIFSPVTRYVAQCTVSRDRCNNYHLM